MSHWQMVMGYTLHIPKNKLELLIQDAKELHACGDIYQFDNHISEEYFMKCLVVEDWWLLIDDESGDIVDIEYRGEKQYWDTDVAVMKLIAKYNDHPEGVVEMSNEYGDMWRWYFRNGNLYTIRAEIRWPELVIDDKVQI